jgi:NAD(P) transhydrogenase subunit alpha
MHIAVLKERYPDEKRVALVPVHAAELIKKSCTISIEAGAGEASGYEDRLYRDRGVEITAGPDKTVANADIVLSVRSGAFLDEDQSRVLDSLKQDQILIGLLDPYRPHPAFDRIADKHITAFALELMPRITRAQSMDVLSSMANLAGYRAVITAASELMKMFPMMMTAAGTIVPARVFVVGAGVAGLQAVATAKRLGAVVDAYDVRPEVAEQVRSLGARFLELELETEESEDSGGYAKAMDEEFYRRQRELMSAALAESDVVITTAAVPGKKAPLLITEEMVKVMSPGSVIVDLAAERGGNCELSVAGERLVRHGVVILAPLNLASSLAYNASSLYSKNITSFLQLMMKDGEAVINPEDEITAACMISSKGNLLREELQQ